MKISTEVIESDDTDITDHDVWVARRAREMGFPVAGTIGDLYEDAVVLIGPIFRFDWKKDRVKIGRVIYLMKGSNVWDFVLQLEDGTQVPCMYGVGYACYFALPEDTEDFCR